MYKSKKRHRTYFLIGLAILLLTIFYIFPIFKKSPEPRPQPKIYSYYKIVDIANGRTLMYISSAPVAKGDELITGDNCRYVVVKVKGNLAYAKYVEKVVLKNSR